MFSILKPYIFSLDPESAHELASKSLKANLKFDNQIKKLNVNIGKKHGLSFNSIAFTRGTNTPWVLFKVDDLGNNNAILSPIDQRRDIKELDGKLVEFMEVLWLNYWN